MDLRAGLWQKQTMKLAMTQELSQAIALLQYSAQELAAFLEERAAENPLIQVEQPHVKAMDPRRDRAKNSNSSSARDQKNWLENVGEEPGELEEHLWTQLTKYTNRHKPVLKLLIESLDENGYLGIDCEELAGQAGVPVPFLEECLMLVQQLEPPGIGARSLQECLRLQLERKSPANPLALSIVSDHFLLFAEKKWKSTSKILGASLKDIQKVHDDIQSLNPRPGAVFKREKSAYVIPDLEIQLSGEDIEIKVFEDHIPKILFNEQYYQDLATYGDGEVSRFLHDKQQDYHWIVRSLEQRKETLVKVAFVIVEKQLEFFKFGTRYLRPMTMREIADQLGIHESTVSRTVRGKYVQTPFGTMELKSFFTSAVSSAAQDNASSSQAKEAIVKLVNSESKQKPLSDQEIAGRLEEEAGIIISRRTVAKYREQLGILPSSKRRRYE